MTILEVDDRPAESALQQRLRRIPVGQRAAVTGSFRAVLGRRIYAFDVSPEHTVDRERQTRISAGVIS